MKRHLLQSTLFLSLLYGMPFMHAVQKIPFLQTQSEKILAAYFSDHAIAVSPYQRVRIQELVNDIYASSPCQLYKAAGEVIAQLQRVIEPNATKKNIYKNFVINAQIEYLEKYKKNIYERLPFTDRMSCSLSQHLRNMQCWLRLLSKKENKDCWHISLADRIIDYINFEREIILFNYHNLLSYFIANKKVALPEIINFWSDRSMHEKLVRRAQSLTHDVSTQSILAELFMIALQSYLMAGNGMYMQWLDQEAEKVYEGYLDQQKKLETEFEVYKNHIDSVQKNAVSQIIKGFKLGLQKVYKTQKVANDTLAKEQTYLFKSINLSYPAAKALNWPAVPYDQLFAASIMKTPASHAWYNIYQVGDWEFDAQNNSFWQNGLIPFGTPFWKGNFYSLQKPGQTTAQNFTDPSQNSIFTEYISNDATYDISVECTLLNVSYPFFVGIIFNRGRWIAGDPERVWQYRLIGLYGTQANPDDPTTREIDLCFAQENITFDDKKQETITSPLELIATAQKNDQAYMYTLPKADVDFLAKDAITFVFDITTGPDSVTIALSKKGKEKLTQRTIGNLKTTIALFSGIGFMAPGAQAEFKIVKPDKLVYSSADLKDFGE